MSRDGDRLRDDCRVRVRTSYCCRSTIPSLAKLIRRHRGVGVAGGNPCFFQPVLCQEEVRRRAWRFWSALDLVSSRWRSTWKSPRMRLFAAMAEVARLDSAPAPLCLPSRSPRPVRL
eukprot:7935522-Pyramimonas_sp.AAC.1